MTTIFGFIGLGTSEIFVILIVLVLLIVLPIVLIVKLVNKPKNNPAQQHAFVPQGPPGKYFLSENGIQIGPFNIEELRSRGITPESPIWTYGLNSWVQAKHLPELQFLFNQP